jgi:hypothetical protein
MQINIDEIEEMEETPLGKVQKKRGRKKGQKIYKEATNKNITIALTQNQYEELSDYADENLIGVSTLIRNLLIKNKIIRVRN